MSVDPDVPNAAFGNPVNPAFLSTPEGNKWLWSPSYKIIINDMRNKDYGL